MFTTVNSCTYSTDKFSAYLHVTVSGNLQNTLTLQKYSFMEKNIIIVVSQFFIARNSEKNLFSQKGKRAGSGSSRYN